MGSLEDGPISGSLREDSRSLFEQRRSEHSGAPDMTTIRLRATRSKNPWNRYERRVIRCLAQNPSPMKLSEITDALGKSRTSSARSVTTAEVRRRIYDDSKHDDGVFVRVGIGLYDLRVKVELRDHIMTRLVNQGFKMGRNGLLERPPMDCKESLRRYHAAARADKYRSMQRFLEKREPALLSDFADGSEVDIESFVPEIQVVEAESHENDLFRYASLLWSVPVSGGFGRRVRFLVKDKHNGKLVGLFALGDPVFNLRCRDEWIGWSVKQREQRLYNVMDIFVLGAVPPYNRLLCGKLIALAACSNEVRRIVEKKYRGMRTVIRNEKKDPRLVLLTTGSALGKSSLYDRIKFNDDLVYQRIGSSEGYGHFHFNDGLFEEMTSFVSLCSPRLSHSNRFGQGPNWKMRISRYCLERLGLGMEFQQHGISREIYAIPLASNFREFLLDKERKPEFIDRPFAQMSAYFKQRWMIGRSQREPGFKNHLRMQVSDSIHSAGECDLVG